MNALVLALLPTIGFVVGLLLGKWMNRDKPVLDKRERRELDSFRQMEDALAVTAAEHTMLGDHFAVIVAGAIVERRQSLRSNR